MELTQGNLVCKPREQKQREVLEECEVQVLGGPKGGLAHKLGDEVPVIMTVLRL